MVGGVASGDVAPLLPLLHAAWLYWHRVWRRVYRVLGVGNTEELVLRIVDVGGCRPRPLVLMALWVWGEPCSKANPLHSEERAS